MKKLVFLIPLLFLIQPAFGDIVVENDQTYIGNDGIIHIVGEIKNDSKSPVNKIKIIATLIDEDGKVLDTINGKIMSNIIMPGMKGSFDIITNEKNITSMGNASKKLAYEFDINKNYKKLEQVIEKVFKSKN